MPEWDQAGQSLLQALGGEGGWPLNIFARPDGRAFFGATALDSPSLETLLRQMLVAWEVDPRALVAQADESLAAVRARDLLCAEPRLPSPVEASALLVEENLDRLLTPAAQSLDPGSGLFGEGSFLYPQIYRALLERASTLRAAHVALETLGRSNACDVLGGGFFRARDGVKLAVENAEMLEMLVRGAKRTRSGFLEHVRAEALRSLREDYALTGGEIASALSESPETYRFSSADLFGQLSGVERTVAQRMLGLSLESQVPVIKSDVGRIALDLGEPPADVQNIAAHVRGRLREARAAREMPAADRVARLAPSWLSSCAVTRVLIECDSRPEDFARAEMLRARVESEGFVLVGRARFEAARLFIAVAKRRRPENPEESRRFLATADRLLGAIEDYVPDVRLSIPFVGYRFDACDSHGRSTVALRLEAWMDRAEIASQLEEVDLQEGIVANLPWQLAHGLELVRTLGLHGAGVYAAFVRYRASLPVGNA